MSYVGTRRSLGVGAALAPRTLGGPLTITIQHGVSGLGDASGSAYANAIQAASDAISSLSTEANALAIAATTPEDQNIAAQAQNFATVAGPRWIQRAQSSGDANQLIALQQGIQGVTADVTSALTTDVIERFLLMDLGVLLVGPFGVLAADTPASTIDAVRNMVSQLPTPPAPQELPLWAFVGGGAISGGLFAFSGGGKPAAALAGGVAGGLLGALVQYGLQKLSDKFNLFGSS